ncbi:helix-turn-helix transcriptional regulator [Methanoculleus oceani]|uniref:ArsR family transcriptional regulator n=1 Tax=Methanoculleus oceani TaxID=2184756 RepID=A0ABD4TDZ5_9EURY|nr:transcriptional regulator FilR1 domain-containing protein [Methanoculleus sp. CWC-02]MCM2466201.1 ArsR family transcriptional regulator [Methanoculleus sp. CWC-02]
MKEISPLEIYNEFHDDLQAIFRSRLLTQVLIALGSGTKPLSTLREITGSSSQALIPKIRQLEALHYVESVRGDYALTPVGRLVEPEIERVVTLMGVLQRHRDFWIEHEIEGIPPEFLSEIKYLYNAKVVKDVEEDIFAVYTAFSTILKKASWIHGVSSIMSPIHADTIKEIVMDGKPVELIVSRELAHRLAAEPYNTVLESLKGYANFRIYVSPSPIRLGMTVTDGYLSLGLYRRNTDMYDATTDLVGVDAAAVAWGERLFQHYKTGSRGLQIPPE